MQTKTAGMWRVGAVLVMAGSVGACMDSQEAPPLAGPSTTAQAVTLSASPDILLHNGSAQSVVTVSMHDEAGQPLAGQRVALGASTGSLSQVEVVTGSDGRAAVIATAPALSTPAAKITVSATPFGTNAENALTRTLTIALTGTLNVTAPTASFTFAPEAPVDPATVVFDASATTDEGQTCGDRCTYAWNFGGLGAGGTSGMVVARSNATQGTYAVTLTVTDNAGTVASTTQAVTVGPPAAAPTP